MAGIKEKIILSIGKRISKPKIIQDYGYAEKKRCQDLALSFLQFPHLNHFRINIPLIKMSLIIASSIDNFGSI